MEEQGLGRLVKADRLFERVLPVKAAFKPLYLLAEALRGRAIHSIGEECRGPCRVSRC